jgi:hypothetical protein
VVVAVAARPEKMKRKTCRGERSSGTIALRGEKARHPAARVLEIWVPELVKTQIVRNCTVRYGAGDSLQR